MSDEEMVALKSKIGTLQILYGVLFGISLVIILLQYTSMGFNSSSTAIWAVTLGGAVCTRLYRTSLVNKYNAELAARAGAPPTIT